MFLSGDTHYLDVYGPGKSDPDLQLRPNRIGIGSSAFPYGSELDPDPILAATKSEIGFNADSVVCLFVSISNKFIAFHCVYRFSSETIVFL